ncbi:MAG: hypothetical protein ABSG43_21325 [Solirubrobacteraceae bacterium]
MTATVQDLDRAEAERHTRAAEQLLERFNDDQSLQVAQISAARAQAHASLALVYRMKMAERGMVR